MKLSAQGRKIPGETLKESLMNLKSYGFEGVELWGNDVMDKEEEVKAAMEEAGLPVSTICSGVRGCLLDSEKKERDLAVSDIKRLIKIAGNLGAVGLITVPIFRGPRLPDLTPLYDTIALEKELLVALLKELAPTAEEAGSIILIESLNRYETHLLRTLGDAVEIARRVDSASVQIMADFFHMNIEETDPAEAIRQAGSYIRHVHLADSTRLQPGTGTIDFKPGFAALKKIGYKNYMTLECGIKGDPTVELPKTVEYLRRCIVEVQPGILRVMINPKDEARCQQLEKLGYIIIRKRSIGLVLNRATIKVAFVKRGGQVFTGQSRNAEDWKPVKDISQLPKR